MQPIDRISRDRLDKIQLAKLSALVDRLRDNPFHRSRIGGPVESLEYIKGIDPFNKRDMLAEQAAHPPFGDVLSVDRAEVAEIHFTSGTSGFQKEVHGLTRVDAFTLGTLSSHAFAWAGMRTGDTAAFNVVITNSAAGQAMYRGISAIGSSPVLIAGASSFEERAEILRRYPVNGLYGTPSAINGLAAALERDGNGGCADLGLNFILVTAEAFPLEWVRRTEELWNTKVFEAYGATQTGSALAAATCERGARVDGGRGVMHLFDWSFLFEVVDPTTLAPVDVGEYGELVVTTLDKQATPLLRFRTGDRVRYMGTDCGCGRQTMMIESGTVGRFDDMFKIKGNNAWASDMEALLFSRGDIDDFRGTVRLDDRSRDNLFLEVAIHPNVVSDKVVDEVRRSFKDQFGFTPAVAIVERDSLPVWGGSAEKKARRFLDARGEGLAAADSK